MQLASVLIFLGLASTVMDKIIFSSHLPYIHTHQNAFFEN